VTQPDNQHQRPAARPGDDDEKVAGQWQRLAGVGFEFIAAIMLLGALGWYLDSRLGWRPWLMMAGGAIGFGVGLFLLVRAGLGSFRD
jgi:F0F1-type ATP synthase assembly protein I